MPTLHLTTRIHAPIERCFDLARSIDLHMHSTGSTGERAIAGVTSGLIGEGEEVTWQARHFGVRQTLTSRITACQRPHHFHDGMVRGAFARLEHDHDFAVDGEVTVMRDTFEFASPLGILGRLVDAVVMTRYLRAFIEERNAIIKQVAESEAWREFLR